MSTITQREATEVAAANASGKQTVVFIHGLWLLASSWDAWKQRFEAEGYATVAVDWPRDAGSVDEARAHPEALAGIGVQEVTDHIAEGVRALDTKPIVIGHSLWRPLDPTHRRPRPRSGVDRHRSRTVQGREAAARVNNQGLVAGARQPGQPQGTVTLTYDQFRYGFAKRSVTR